MDTQTNIWIKNSEKVWVKGQIIKKLENNEFLVFNNFLNKQDVIKNNDLSIANKITNKKNLIDLIHLHEAAILNALNQHYHKDSIYTYTGPILIAINPFKILPIYTKELLKQHQLFGINNNKINPNPHVYSIADYAYRNLCKSNKSQSILISGESGAGKTVSTKVIMKYLTQTGSSKSTSLNNIESTILDSNPILEAFGNAATIRNNNSSRFGKYIKLCFKNKVLDSGCIETYLLELVRIIKQVGNERNFHIFYQLFEGLTDKQLETLHLQRKNYTIINNVSAEGINDRLEFDNTCQALKTMKCDENQQMEIWSLVSGIILLGELTPKSINKNNPIIHDICDLFKLNSELLIEKLTTKKIVTPSETFTKQLTKQEIIKTKDTIIKIYYDQLFKWLVKLINRNINVEKKNSQKFIGILDIFGFEVFQNNYFEQLCINFTNEILQQQFNKYIFKLEQQEYKAEQINWDMIDFPDNQDCIDLITKKPYSVFTLLDEECSVGDNNDTAYHRKLERHLKEHSRITFTNKMNAKQLFIIHHYAGEVTYNTNLFCFKNKQIMSHELLELLYNSKLPLIQQFVEQNKINNSKHSVNKKFQKQLNSLMKVISKTNTHYIRCIKPNDVNKPNTFNTNKVVEQLRYAGVLEAIKVARAGFPIRFKKMEFITQFQSLFNWKFYPDMSHNDIINAIISKCNIETGRYQIGLTKVFFKKQEYHIIDDIQTQHIYNNAVKIQSSYRMFVLRHKYLKMISSSVLVQSWIRRHMAVLKYKQMRRNYYAKKIETWWRCVYNTMKYKIKKQSIEIIKRSIKTCIIVKKINGFLNKWRLTVKLQSFIRCYFTKKHYTNKKHSVIILQKYVKRFISCLKETKNTNDKQSIDAQTKKTNNKKAEVAKEIVKIEESIKDNRIDLLENKICEMQVNFSDMMKTLTQQISQAPIEKQKIDELKDEINKKEIEIIKQDAEIEKKDNLIKKSKKVIEQQKKIMEQDEVVKQDMGKKLQDVLLALNQAQEEIIRLKKINTHRKNWFW